MSGTGTASVYRVWRSHPVFSDQIGDSAPVRGPAGAPAAKRPISLKVPPKSAIGLAATATSQDPAGKPV